MLRKTKIVATLGPSCDSLEGIIGVIEAGANVLRVNTSHLTSDAAVDLYQRIDEARGRVQRTVAVLVDLQGPKLRLGRWKGEPEPYAVGQAVRLAEERLSVPDTVPVAIRDFADLLQEGQRIVLGDGAPVLTVTGRSGDIIDAEVLEAGDIRPRMGITFPGGANDLPPLTASDLEHLRAAAPYADFVALSFVRRAADMELLRQRLDELNCAARMIAKIERASALEELDDIIAIADAVMVARGDLGIELGLAHVPFAQERILRACQRGSKPP